MKEYYSVEINKDDPCAVSYCLRRLENGIPEFEYEWRIYIHSGGINYGIYFNIDVKRKEIEISNCPRYGDGDDYIDDVLEIFEEEEEEEEEEM